VRTRLRLLILLKIAGHVRDNFTINGFTSSIYGHKNAAFKSSLHKKNLEKLTTKVIEWGKEALPRLLAVSSRRVAPPPLMPFLAAASS
jgi:hypothetical protein